MKKLFIAYNINGDVDDSNILIVSANDEAEVRDILSNEQEEHNTMTQGSEIDWQPVDYSQYEIARFAPSDKSEIVLIVPESQI